ncbi:hypothetical protein OIPHN260_27490 [Enterobacter roggenkampii]|uniref:Protein of avirulence locus ImpE n=1 Tax=Enterobacter roggenkampii TaxID=1812935 RepID=A0AAU9BFV6_9ENTR|nr:hypothetical protein OIPHN260_27490 [Enterobacter roggenkampii]
MNTLYQHLAGESLNDALARLEAEIKARPADADLRAAFVQFLTLSGNWTRALTQLKSWLALKPQAKPTVTLLEQSIQGELQRAQVMAGQARPAMPETQWPWLTTLAAALSEEGERAQALRLEALEQAQATPGQITLENEETQAFDWLMDGDARLGPVCETIVNGRYFWLPFNAIAEFRFRSLRAYRQRRGARLGLRLAEVWRQPHSRRPFADRHTQNLEPGQRAEKHFGAVHPP